MSNPFAGLPPGPIKFVPVELEKALVPTSLDADGQSIRMFDIDHEPWFVASDICKKLDITDMTRAVKRLDDDEQTKRMVDTPGGQQQMIIVSEPGVYRLVLNSRSPAADSLYRWLTHEVLPAIRKHGAYVSTEVQLELAKEWLHLRSIALSSESDYKKLKYFTRIAATPPSQLLDPDVVETLGWPEAVGLAADIRARRELLHRQQLAEAEKKADAEQRRQRMAVAWDDAR